MSNKTNVKHKIQSILRIWSLDKHFTIRAESKIIFSILLCQPLKASKSDDRNSFYGNLYGLLYYSDYDMTTS